MKINTLTLIDGPAEYEMTRELDGDRTHITVQVHLERVVYDDDGHGKSGPCAAEFDDKETRVFLVAFGKRIDFTGQYRQDFDDWCYQCEVNRKLGYPEMRIEPSPLMQAVEDVTDWISRDICDAERHRDAA